MYCSKCGKRQKEGANFCSLCGNSLKNESDEMNNSTQVYKAATLTKIKKVRRWLVISFISAYFFLWAVFAFREVEPYYYVNFFPYGLFQMLTVLFVIFNVIFSYKLTSLLVKKTHIIIIYTILSPFFLINAITFIGLLADSKKFLDNH